MDSVRGLAQQRRAHHTVPGSRNADHGHLSVSAATTPGDNDDDRDRCGSTQRNPYRYRGRPDHQHRSRIDPDSVHPRRLHPVDGVGAAVAQTPMGGRKRPRPGSSPRTVARKRRRGRCRCAVDVDSTGSAALAWEPPQDDRIDAAAAACVAALQGDGYPVVVEDHTDVLRILDERRRSLIAQSTRVRNQLHAILRELVPRGAKTDLDSEKAALALRRVTPTTPSEVMRKTIAREMVGDLRRLRVQLIEITERTEAVLAECGTNLMSIHGVGPVTAARILAHTGNPFRFPSEAAFANFTGTAPIEVSSAENTRHLLSRWRPHAELGHPCRCRCSSPYSWIGRTHLLPPQTRRRQNATRRATLPQTSSSETTLERHALRRNTAGRRFPQSPAADPPRLSLTDIENLFDSLSRRGLGSVLPKWYLVLL